MARGGAQPREGGIRISLILMSFGVQKVNGVIAGGAQSQLISNLGGCSLTFGLPCCFWGVMYSPLKSIFAFTLRHLVENNN